MPSTRRGSGITFAENVTTQTSPGQDKPAEAPKGYNRERRMSFFPRPMLPSKRTVSQHFNTPEPEEMIDDEVLFSRLQKMFIAAEEDGRTGLAIDEFKEAMRKTVGRHSTVEEMEFLFMKVDANCDGVVDWEEYVTFTLLEYKERTLMIEMLREKPFPNEMREIDSRHRDTIVRILFYPNIRKSGSKQFVSDFKSGKYVTLSKEGTIGLWSLSMKTVKYYNANHYTDRNTQPWFTDMVAMYNVNMLAIASTDRDITIYDMSGKKFNMRYYVTGFENCITTMDYWVNPKDLNVALLLIGDTSGSVSSIKFETALRGGPFGAVSGKKNTCKRVSFPEVVRGFVIGVRAQKFPNVHEDWVNKVQYLPDIDCFLSSCQAPHTALFFGDFAGKKTHVYFKVNKGVLSFDYSHALNIIVTGGMDYMLRVWNPYVNNKAIVLLKGHTKPVNHVIINGNKNQVISIDKGRSLRVYDLRDQTCLQQISGRMIKFDPFPISAVFFNGSMRTTLLAANQLVLLEKREEEERFSEILSHNKAVVGALYNKVFNSVVSACRESVVSIWDVNTGDKLMQFVTAHCHQERGVDVPVEVFNSVVTACRESVVSIWDVNTGDKLMQFVNAHCRQERGVDVPVEITALCFDNNGRRLVTGARNGTIHVWNFNNGSCMQKFELPDSSDVTGIVCTTTRMYVSGWGKTVHIYVDGGGEEHRKQWKTQHKEDILCIAYLPPNIIATGAYDGNVIIWSRETGQVYCRLNAFESLKPIAETTNYSTTSTSVTKSRKLSTGAHVHEAEPPLPEEDGDEDKTDVVRAGYWTKRNVKLMGVVGMLSRRSNSGDSYKSEAAVVEETCEHPLLQALNPDTFDVHEKSVYSRDEYDTVCKFYESSVEKMLFLEAREPLQKDTAVVVTSGAEGWIRFWSLHNEGGLLGQFNAAHKVGESVLALKCDVHNHFLVTGDTDGYVKVWNIRDYCVEDKMTPAEKKHLMHQLRKKFTFFRVETYDGKTSTRPLPAHIKSMFSNRPPPACSEPDKTLKYPLLVNSFRAHTRSIHSVDYVTEREILITASADCSVRMWTINGQYIGTFGGELWSPLPRVVNNDYFLSQIPSDIRRSGSARTLKVMHGGKTPLWQNAMSEIRHRSLERIKKQFEHLQPKENYVMRGGKTPLWQNAMSEIRHRSLERIKKQFEHLQPKENYVMHGGKTPLWQNAMSEIRHRSLERIKKQFEHLQPKENYVMRGGKTPLWQNAMSEIRHRSLERIKKQFEHLQPKENYVMHGGKTPLWQNALSVIRHRGLERIKKQFEHMQPKEEAEAEAEEDAESTNILGKSYKRQMKHKMRPRLPKFIETPGSVAVYHTLPFVELSKVDALNATIRDVASRRAETMAFNRMRGTQKKKQDVPAILNIYNKVVNKPNQPIRGIVNRVSGRMKKVADRFQGGQFGSNSAKKRKQAQQAATDGRRSSSSNEGGDARSVRPGEGDGSRGDLTMEYAGDEYEAAGDKSTLPLLPLISSKSSAGQSRVGFQLPSIVE